VVGHLAEDFGVQEQATSPVNSSIATDSAIER